VQQNAFLEQKNAFSENQCEKAILEDRRRHLHGFGLQHFWEGSRSHHVSQGGALQLRGGLCRRDSSQQVLQFLRLTRLALAVKIQVTILTGGGCQGGLPQVMRLCWSPSTSPCNTGVDSETTHTHAMVWVPLVHRVPLKWRVGPYAPTVGPSLGPLCSSSTQHRRTPEIVLGPV